MAVSQTLCRVRSASAGNGPYGLNGNIDNTWKAFAPRLGLAYQFTPKTVVRMGYGRSFDIGVFGSNFGHVVTQNLPVLANETIQAANVESPLPAINCISDFQPRHGAVLSHLTRLPLPAASSDSGIPDSGLLPLQGPNRHRRSTNSARPSRCCPRLMRGTLRSSTS